MKYFSTIDAIEDIDRVPICDRISKHSRDFSVGDPLKYYGACTSCTPAVSRRHHIDWGHIQMCSVEKQCAQADGGLAVLEPHMFLCIVCKSLQEPEDATFKKCPHCGIKTLKPEGCNYVQCGDHRWCWICNERLENNYNGHNTHYYTGLPGASPYASECRKSLNQDKPMFILNSCDCSSCSTRGGDPLCKTIDCMETAISQKYCLNCESHI
jgi:hypothetical protein